MSAEPARVTDWRCPSCTSTTPTGHYWLSGEAYCENGHGRTRMWKADIVVPSAEGDTAFPVDILKMSADELHDLTKVVAPDHEAREDA